MYDREKEIELARATGLTQEGAEIVVNQLEKKVQCEYEGEVMKPAEEDFEEIFDEEV